MSTSPLQSSGAISLMEQELNRAQIREIFTSFNRSHQRCFTDCVNKFDRRSVTDTEKNCVANCVAKYMNTTQRISMRFQEHQAVLTGAEQSAEGNVPLDAPEALSTLVDITINTHKEVLSNSAPTHPERNQPQLSHPTPPRDRNKINGTHEQQQYKPESAQIQHHAQYRVPKNQQWQPDELAQQQQKRHQRRNRQQQAWHQGTQQQQVWHQGIQQQQAWHQGTQQQQAWHQGTQQQQAWHQGTQQQQAWHQGTQQQQAWHQGTQQQQAWHQGTQQQQAWHQGTQQQQAWHQGTQKQQVWHQGTQQQQAWHQGTQQQHSFNQDVQNQQQSWNQEIQQQQGSHQETQEQKKSAVIARYPNSERLWHRFDEFSLFDWSISGNETCIVVHGCGFHLVLDLGACPPQAVDSDVVFISHGHVDHCGALHMHIRKRQLLRLPPATYYMPECLVEPIKATLEIFARMQDDEDYSAAISAPNKIIGVQSGDSFPIGDNLSDLTLEIFGTEHRVPSLGCILRRKSFNLLPECRNLSRLELHTREAQGLPIHGEPKSEPLLAYTGDTKFDVFMSGDVPDLLKVRLLISELTFLDGAIERADKYGHCHLDQFAKHWKLFGSINQLVFVHFSNRYSPKEIRQRVYSGLPTQLSRRVYCALTAKQLLYS